MADEILIVVRSLEQVAERAVRDLALEVTSNLIQTTPVDTGWARANWVPSIGEPFKGTAGSRAQAEAGSIDSAPQQAGTAQVAQYKSLDQGRVHITNNVPYIGTLNDGSSRQAPAAFVQAAIGKAIAEVARRR